MANATIDWGDGSAVEQVTVTPSGATNAWSFSGKTHTYAASGSYTVKVTGPYGGSDSKQAAGVLVEVVVLTVNVNGSTVTAGGTGHT